MIALQKSQEFILLFEWLPVGDDLVTAMPLTILMRIFKFQRPLWMIRSRNFQISETSLDDSFKEFCIILIQEFGQEYLN